MDTLAYMAIAGVILLGLAVLAAWLLRNRSAALRHVIWLMALVGLLILPGFCLLGPHWPLPVIPIKTTQISAPPPARTVLVRPTAPKMAIASGAPSHEISQAQPAPLSTTIRQSPRPRRGSSPRYFPHGISASQWIVLAWLIGTLFLFAKLLFGFILAARLRNKATLVEDQPRNALARNLAHQLGIAHPVQLLATPDSPMPMAMGLFRPAILLPIEARDWTDEKRRMVLLHELAHVHRRDCLSSALAQIGLSLHWFNPLAWLAMRRLVIEREQACDDVVLNAGSLSSNYAGCLLDIARHMRAAPLPITAIPMARPGQLERRLRAILNAARPRSAATCRMVIFSLIITALLTLPLATIRLTAAQTKKYTPITAADQPTSNITGVVIDESGKPIAGVKVSAVELDKMAKVIGQQTTSTNSRGQYTFKDLQRGRWLFLANDPRYAWDWKYEHVQMVPTLPETLPVTIKLYEPHTLHGTVVNETGQPVPGVHVILVNQQMPGQKNPVPIDKCSDLLTVQTDAQGRFTMNRLRQGQASFCLERTGYAKTFASAQIDQKTPTLTIRKGLTLHGKVVHQGHPLPNVKLSASADESHRNLLDWHGTTDANGQFQVPHVPSRILNHDCHCPAADVQMQDAGWYSANYSVYQTTVRKLPFITVEAIPKIQKEDSSPMQIDIGKPGKSATADELIVRVPHLLANQAITVWAIPQPFLKTSLPAYGVAQKGTAVFNDLAPGRYLIDADSLPPKTIELAAGQTLDVTLEPGPVQIRGAVRSGGKPVADGKIAWFFSPKTHSDFRGRAPVQADGSYVINGLLQGEYRLVYEAPNSMYNLFDVHAGKGVTSFDINLPTSEIEGKLMGPTPRTTGPEQVLNRINIMPRQDSIRLNNVVCVVAAEPDGQFTVHHLPPGRYAMIGYSLTANVTIPHGNSIVSATLGPPEKFGQIAGTITGHLPAIRDSAHSIRVVAFPKDQDGYNFVVWGYSAHATVHNTYRLTNLPVGTYGLFVSSGSKGPVEFWIPSIEVRDGLVRNLPINIPPERQVAIIPENLDEWDMDKPVCSGWHLLMPGGDWLSGGLLVSGGLTTEPFPLPMGMYTVVADYGQAGSVIRKFTVKPGKGALEINIKAPHAH